MTVLLGKSTVAADNTGGNFDFCIFSRFQCTDTGTVTSLNFRVGVNAGTFLRLALYSDNAGVVEHVLAQGTATPAANTWKSVTGLSVAVTKDTWYWLGVKLDGCFCFDAGRRAYVAYPGDVAFTDHPAYLSYDDNASISMYADGIVPVSITVSAVAMTATATAPAPAVSVTIGISIAAATSTATAITPTPAVSTTFSLVIAPAPMTASAAVPVPAAIAGYAEVVGVAMTASAIMLDSIIHKDIESVTMTATTTILAPIISISPAPIVPGAMTISAALRTPVPAAVQAQAEATLVGERLEVIHDPAITSAVVAGYVAIAVLAKARLDGKKAQITVPPHCGLELWDVVNIFDNTANQNINYRVRGYSFEYDTSKAQYVHRLELCAV